MSKRRFILIAVLVAIIQAWVGVTALSSALAIGDGGGHVPWRLTALVYVTSVPGVYLSNALESSLGDPASILVGFGISGLVWGCLIAVAARYWMRRRSRQALPVV